MTTRASNYSNRKRLDSLYWQCQCNENSIHHVEQEVCCACGVTKNEGSKPDLNKIKAMLKDQATEEEKPTRPNQLPVIEYEGIFFVVDLRLEEIRQADKPYLTIKFEDVEDDKLAGKIADIWVCELV